MKEQRPWVQSHGNWFRVFPELKSHQGMKILRAYCFSLLMFIIWFIGSSSSAWEPNINYLENQHIFSYLYFLRKQNNKVQIWVICKLFLQFRCLRKRSLRPARCSHSCWKIPALLQDTQVLSLQGNKNKSAFLAPFISAFPKHVSLKVTHRSRSFQCQFRFSCCSCCMS